MEIAHFDRYAIFQSGGKQYQAIEGKTVCLEKLEVAEGELVTIPEVLLRKTGADRIEIGAPFVSTPITARVIKHNRGPKLIVFKFKRRKSYQVTQGHRQEQTIVRIESI